MTQEDKKLLLIDLCGRLPYDFKVSYYDPEEDCEVINIVDDISSYGYVGLECDYSLTIESIKPYLFPMSSMTEEQEEELRKLCTFNCLDYLTLEAVDWLNAHHFDFRGLIEKGLAIDCTNLNIY